VTATISVAFNDSIYNPGYEITLGNLTDDPDHDTFRIICRDPEGVYPDQIVRGTDHFDISGAAFLVTDYEFPQFRSVEYRLELYDGGVLDATISTGTLTGLPGAYFITQNSYPLFNSWIQSVEQPVLNQPCFVEKFNNWKRDGRLLAKQNVLGRSKPVVVSDVMAGREGQLTFWVGGVLPDPWNATDSFHEYNLLFDEGRTLLFRTYEDRELGHKPLYFMVDAIDYERKGKVHPRIHNGSIQDATDGIWLFKVTLVEVDRPATGTILLSDVTWDDVENTATTWNDLVTNRSTWFEVYQDPTLP
jgi:hypothetical protein